MAFLQNDFPPSSAPLLARATTVAAVARGRRPLITLAPKPRRFGLGRIATIVAGLVAAALPGYLVAQSTESLALGILASDFAFLMAVAIGSAFSRH